MSKNQVKNTLEGVFKYSLLAFIGLFPFILFKGYLYNGTSSRAVVLMILIDILAIIFAIYLFKKDKIIKIFKSPISIILSLYFLVLIVAGLNGVDPSTSFWSKAARTTGIFYFSHLVIFYYFLTSLFKEEINLRQFLKVFLISTGIYSFLAFLGPEGVNLILKSKPWDGFSFGNSTFAAMYLYVGFLLCIYFINTIKNKKWWHNLLPIFFLINPYIISSKVWFGNINLFKNPLGIIGEAKATTYVIFASAVALVGFWMVSKIKESKIRRIILLSVAVLGLILAIFAIRSFLSDGGYLREIYLKQATGIRPIVWELSGEAIKEKPILGWGPDNFDRLFEKNYDNRVLEEKNGNEAWLDRAHNVFIDQTVDTGYLGTSVYIFVYLVVFASLLYVILKSKEKDDQLMGVILLVYFVGHLAELQTAFDTTISFISTTIMLALASNVFSKTYISNNPDKKYEISLPQYIKYSLGVVLVGYFSWAFFAGTLPIARAEHINGKIRTVGSSEKRIPMYSGLFGSPMDVSSFLWRTSTDFQRGISENPSSLENSKNQENFKKELAIFADEYKNYLEKNPNDIRAHFNFADILIYSNLFGVDRLEEANIVLDEAITLNPNIPQGYWMKAVLSLYQGKFNIAREWANKGLEVNPNIEKSRQVVDYIESSIKTFPEVDLYFFDKI